MTIRVYCITHHSWVGPTTSTNSGQIHRRQVSFRGHRFETVPLYNKYCKHTSVQQGRPFQKATRLH
uniref:Uncharacterized protein n=1 Tax=Anguilla anguilla TaxID=7936 RepID=A0A0E9XCQ8_ANGAN